MTKLNRVIYDIERCISHELWSCPACSKYNKEGIKPGQCADYLLADALKLLKSQPDIVRCKDCKHSCDYTDIYPDHAYKCTKNGGYHNDSWFCADGER